MTQELQEHSVRCYAHKLKPLNHVTVIPHPLSPPRFNSHGRGYSPVVFPTPLLLVWKFRLRGICLSGGIGVATLAAGVRARKGFIDSMDAVPVGVW